MVSNKIIRAEPSHNYEIEVWFKNGLHGIFRLEPYLEKGLFRTLKDKELFSAVRVEYGTLVWPGEIDIAPDTVESDLVLL